MSPWVPRPWQRLAGTAGIPQPSLPTPAPHHRGAQTQARAGGLLHVPTGWNLPGVCHGPGAPQLGHTHQQTQTDLPFTLAEKGFTDKFWDTGQAQHAHHRGPTHVLHCPWRDACRN